MSGKACKAEAEQARAVRSVAIYCRVSSHEQKQKGDLERQKLRVLEFCIKNKYRVEFVFDVEMRTKRKIYCVRFW